VCVVRVWQAAEKGIGRERERESLIKSEIKQKVAV